MEAAVRSRRVTVRPAPDGMAYLTVLGPMPEVVGAYTSLRARASAVVGGQCPEERPDGRGTGAVMADTATRLLSGRAAGEAQPVEVHLVMTDRALMGTGDPGRSVFEPARVPGHGSVPAPVARAWLRRGLEGPAEEAGVDAARVWVRRLYTSPDGRDLVALDSRRRLFRGLLRRMLVLRDDVCTTPWCEAPIAHADHTVPARDGSPTSYAAGNGKCARCNLGKEAPGWVTELVPAVTTGAGCAAGEAHGARGAAGQASVTRAGAMGPPRQRSSRLITVTTPLGRVYESEPPPLLGWGSAPPGMPTPPPPPPRLRPRAQPWAPGRKRPCRRPRALPSSSTARRRARRPRLTSHLERELCRLLS
jgi:hypothetical protein